MILCITSESDTLDSPVDPRFGRCQYFVIIDTETMQFEAVRNPNIDSMGGAGVQSGQMMSEHNVKAVLSGNIGPNAFQTLSAAGIEIITGVSGTVREAVEKFRKGEYKKSEGPSVGSKFGMPK